MKWVDWGVAMAAQRGRGDFGYGSLDASPDGQSQDQQFGSGRKLHQESGDQFAFGRPRVNPRHPQQLLWYPVLCPLLSSNKNWHSPDRIAPHQRKIAVLLRAKFKGCFGKAFVVLFSSTKHQPWSGPKENSNRDKTHAIRSMYMSGLKTQSRL